MSSSGHVPINKQYEDPWATPMWSEVSCKHFQIVNQGDSNLRTTLLLKSQVMILETPLLEKASKSRSRVFDTIGESTLARLGPGIHSLNTHDLELSIAPRSKVIVYQTVHVFGDNMGFSEIISKFLEDVATKDHPILVATPDFIIERHSL
jgi:hypothetical protein